MFTWWEIIGIALGTGVLAFILVSKINEFFLWMRRPKPDPTLMPCPSCKNNEDVQLTHQTRPWHKDDPGTYAVFCRCFMHTDWFDTEKEAREAWNTEKIGLCGDPLSLT